MENTELLQKIQLLEDEVKLKNKRINNILNSVKFNSLQFLLNSNLSKEDKEIFKEIFEKFLSE